jgi:hypothetical protein
MKSKKYLAALAIGTVAILVVYLTLFRSNGRETKVVVAAGQQTVAVTSVDPERSQSTRGVSGSQTSAKDALQVSATSSKSVVLPSGGNTGTSSGAPLSWHAVSRSEDVAAGILSLLASANPDDWMKASALNLLCASAVPTDAERMGNVKNELSIAHKQLLEHVRQRCGDAAASTVPLVQSGMAVKAKEAGSTVAKARITTTNLKDGLTNDEVSAIRDVVNDPDLASAWLTLNRSGLLKAMTNSEAFGAASPSEQYGAYSLALCSLGEDCSPKSLHALSLCVQSLYAACNSTSVQEGVMSTISPDRRAKVSEYAQLLITSLRNGNLTAIGMKAKAGT